MIKEIFEFLKKEISLRYPDYKFALGGVIERLPTPERLDEFLPIFVLQPRTEVDTEFDTAGKISKKTINFHLYLIKRWTGEPEDDLDKNYEILENIRPIVLKLETLGKENWEIKEVKDLAINFEPDVELFFRTGFYDLTGISLEFNVIILKNLI